jgi:hypothetical protein
LSQAQPASKTWGVLENVSFSGQVVADKLKKFIDAGGFKFSGCPTPPEPILESRAVYLGILLFSIKIFSFIFYTELRRGLKGGMGGMLGCRGMNRGPKKPLVAK